MPCGAPAEAVSQSGLGTPGGALPYAAAPARAAGPGTSARLCPSRPAGGSARRCGTAARPRSDPAGLPGAMSTHCAGCAPCPLRAPRMLRAPRDPAIPPLPFPPPPPQHGGRGGSGRGWAAAGRGCDWGREGAGRAAPPLPLPLPGARGSCSCGGPELRWRSVSCVPPRRTRAGGMSHPPGEGIARGS